jgi:putative ABC transport system permease protein
MRRSAHTLAIGFAALRANPLRTALSTLGVVIGVASLVAILALADGLERYSRQQIAETTDLQMVMVEPQTVERGPDGVLVRRTDVPVLTAGDAADLARATAGRADVTLGLTASGWLTVDGDTARHAVIVMATLPGAEQVLPLALAAGRLIVPGDLAADTAAVLSPSAAHAVAPSQIPAALVGRSIRLNGTSYQVVGVLAGEPAGAARVYVPLGSPALAAWGENGRTVPAVLLRARRVEDVERVRAAAGRWLARRFGTAPPFTVSSHKARAEQARRGVLVFKLVMGSITGISILVGGIGIMNILLASVAERTREIGVRRSLGARRRDIRLQFLAESVAIAGVGSLLGVGLGLGGAFGITGAIRSTTGVPLRAAFTWITPLVAALVALAVGVIFGTYPAVRAARLAPIEAIRRE